MSGAVISDTPLKKGDLVPCKNPECNQNHPVRLGMLNGMEDDSLMVVTCPLNKASYLVGTDGFKIIKE